MNRRWWKAYFLLALTLTVGGFAYPLLVDVDWDMHWWEWLFFPLYALQVCALYGFSFWLKLGTPRGWKLLFVASLAYEIWCLVDLTTNPELRSVTDAETWFLASTIGMTLVVQLPMFIALFLYGFRSKGLWYGAA